MIVNVIRLKNSDVNQHSEDIQLDDATWLPYVDLGDNWRTATNIDSLLESTAAYWTTLEKHCVPACCGIKALTFLPEDLRTAADFVKLPNLLPLLKEFRADVATIENFCVQSTKLNETLSTERFLSLLDHVITCLDSIQEGG